MKNFLLCGALTCLSLVSFSQNKVSDTDKYLNSMHKNITSEKLFNYVKELSNPKYEGRLAGSAGMEKASQWASDRFKEWGLIPVGDNGTYIKAYPHPCVEVKGDCSVSVSFPIDSKSKTKSYISKEYIWAKDWYAGGTSASGEITADVVYAGFGVTAPELGYDDYKGIDVKGKIVLIEGETPNQSRNADTLRMWYNHTLHNLKLKNAVDHGAIGMLYKWVPGPNNGYYPNFVYAYVNGQLVDDIFEGTGRNYRDNIKTIYKTKIPQSFNTGKKATIKMTTTYNPNATGKNIVGVIKGSDPKLSEEFIIISGHIDHLGMVPHHIAGANDNNSATAVLMGVAEAFAKSEVKPKRSILFINIDGEEAGLTGSAEYVKNPIVPKEKTVAVLNLEQVGIGDRFSVSYGVEYPGIKRYFDEANDKFIHRSLSLRANSHITRPRTDGAVFMKALYPCVDLGASGGVRFYHNPKDDWNTINPETLQDMAKLVYMTTIALANDPNKIDLGRP